MSTYSFPATDFDKPNRLLSLLGSHWSQHYEGAAAVSAMLQGAAQLETQNLRDLQELVDCTSVETVPLHHEERWWALTLKESDMQSTAALSRYGDALKFGTQADGTTRQYGVKGDRAFVFPLPEGLVGCGGMFNRITDPSVSLFPGVEVSIDVNRKTLSFVTNPFASPLIAVRPVYSGATVVDQELQLWVFNAKFDRQYVTQHFGYVFGLDLPSTPATKNFVRALMRGIVAGPSYRAIADAVSALTDTATAAGDETVETVFTDANGVAVVTDKTVYRFPADAIATVAPGDTLSAGDPLVDTITIHEFHSGTVPADLRVLAVGGGLLNAGYFGDLLFPNKTVPWVVEENVKGYTKLSFELTGIPTDVDKFWDDLHAAGIRAGKTLAMLLDTRSNPSGQPTAGALPTSVNPLEFLLANVWRNNLYLVRVKARRLGPDALPLSYGRWLKKLTPPGSCCVVLLELEADPTTVTMDGPGDATVPGFEEYPTLFDSIETVGETIDTSTIVDEYPILRYDTDFCV